MVPMPGNAASDPPAEPVLKVESREELVYLLGQACEIEHGLICEYLYAQFSLKRGPDEGLTEDQLARVQAWEAALISVIKQEMLLLALATNILTAIGAAPHFERPNFPIVSRWYPAGVQIALVPFGERALRHFIYLERPEGMTLDDAAGFAAARHAQPLTAGGAGLVAVAEEWQTVGHLYRGIEAGLANLCARRIPMGQDREVGPLEMRRRPDGRQNVGGQRQVQHLLLDHADHRSFPGLHPHQLGRRQALVRAAFERELRVQVFTHQPVLDFARLTQQIHQLLAGIHLQHWLSRWITRHVARHRHRLTPRAPLRASQIEVSVSRPLVAKERTPARQVTLASTTSTAKTPTRGSTGFIP